MGVYCKYIGKYGPCYNCIILYMLYRPCYNKDNCIDELGHERCNSIANARQLRVSCTNLLVFVSQPKTNPSRSLIAGTVDRFLRGFYYHDPMWCGLLMKASMSWCHAGVHMQSRLFNISALGLQPYTTERAISQDYEAVYMQGNDYCVLSPIWNLCCWQCKCLQSF